MRNPYFEEEHEQLRRQVSRFVASEIVPHGDDWEAQESVPRELLRKMGALGFLGLMYEDCYGGSGMDVRAAVVLAEELSRSTYAGVTITALVHSCMASPHLLRGSSAQRARYLPGVVSGELLTAICITEPSAGSDVAGIRSRAVLEEDEWVINGSKMFITNGVNADIYIVAAKTDSSAKGSRGISMFIVERGTPGLVVGRSLKKHGWRCSDTAELFFEDLRIPKDNLLGELNRGFYSVMEKFQHERLLLAAMAVGEAQTALDITLEYVKNRIAFGAPLYAKDTVREKCARMQTKISLARNYLYYVAWADAQGTECIREVSMLKAFACDMATEVTYDCLQLHGGMGFMQESTIERMYRDARVLPIGGGTSEVMYGEVAKRI